MTENTSRVGIFSFEVDSSADPALLAKRAEELGFESFWVPEHAILPVRTTSPYAGSADGVIPEEYGRIVDPFIALARASAVTSRIKLGTGICLVPERNPLLLAKVIATLDRYSDGRSYSASARGGCGRRRRLWAPTSNTGGARPGSPSRR